MPDSYAVVYLHFVWATKLRQDVIPPEAERDLYRVITHETKRQNCSVVAIGGTSNHVHLLVRFGRTTTFAKFMDQVKGVSSAFLNDYLGLPDDQRFHWQPGYGVFSVGINQVDPVVAYINNQKAHHAANTFRPAWEPPDDTPPAKAHS